LVGINDSFLCFAFTMRLKVEVGTIVYHLISKQYAEVLAFDKRKFNDHAEIYKKFCVEEGSDLAILRFFDSETSSGWIMDSYFFKVMTPDTPQNRLQFKLKYDK
jgi:hypothetical protein